MASVSLKLKSQTNMFGTTVSMVSRNQDVKQVIAENLDFDPLKNHKNKIEKGFLFRSPKITNDIWQLTLKSLRNVDGEYNFKLSMDKDSKDIDALIKFKNKNDAAVFAWTNLQHWQKWSDAQEEEEQAAAKERKKPLKAKVNKDGSVTVKVKVTTLKD
jgi:hypothetical protein